MIRLLIGVILALGVGGSLAYLMVEDPGYVLVSYGTTTLETSLWFAAICLMVLVLAVYLVAFVVRRIARGGFVLSDWLRWRRVSRSRNRSLQGLMLAAEGRWQEAEQAFLDSAEGVDTPLVNYLGAARAANERHRFERRDEILERAREATPEAAFAVELVRAELQQTAGQWRLSIATLDALRQRAPRHPLVLQRLFAANEALGDWDAVAELAPALPRNADPDTQGIDVATWRARLAKSRDSVDASEHARRAWKAMPRRLRVDEGLLLDYVDILAASAPQEAEAVLRRSLKKDWHDAWVCRYGRIEGDRTRQLETAKSWLKHRPDDPSVLLTLGRLSRAEGDLAAAMDYLQTSLAGREDADTLEELGLLLAANGDTDAAHDYFRRALALNAAPRTD